MVESNKISLIFASVVVLLLPVSVFGAYGEGIYSDSSGVYGESQVSQSQQASAIEASGSLLKPAETRTDTGQDQEESEQDEESVETKIEDVDISSLSEDQLRERIEALESLIAKLKLDIEDSSVGEQSTPESTVCDFTRDLTLGMRGEDVKCLQKTLNKLDFVLAETGPGSPGQENTYFGGLKRDALSKFQSKKGIVPAVGYFGPITRNFFSQ